MEKSRIHMIGNKEQLYIYEQRHVVLGISQKRLKSKEEKSAKAFRIIQGTNNMMTPSGLE